MQALGCKIFGVTLINPDTLDSNRNYGWKVNSGEGEKRKKKKEDHRRFLPLQRNQTVHRIVCIQDDDESSLARLASYEPQFVSSRAWINKYRGEREVSFAPYLALHCTSNFKRVAQQWARMLYGMSTRVVEISMPFRGWFIREKEAAAFRHNYFTRNSGATEKIFVEKLRERWRYLCICLRLFCEVLCIEFIFQNSCVFIKIY